MTAKQQGMFKDAHPTAPGGMSLSALKVELVEQYGYNMADLRGIIWGDIINMVIEARLAREKEEGVVGPAHEEWETEVIEPDEVGGLTRLVEQMTDDMDAEDDTDPDLDADDDEFLVHPSRQPLAKMIESEVPPSTDEAVEFAEAALPLYNEVADDVSAFMAEIEAAQAEYAASALFIGMPTTRDFIFDGHAGAGPSGAERWMTCTASLGAAREFLETLTVNQQHEFASGNTAARQGTTAHAVGEVKVREIIGEVDSSEVDATLMELALMPDEVRESYDEEMDAYVSEYVDLAQSYHTAGHTVLVEQRVTAAIPLTESGLVEDDLYFITGSADLVSLPTEDEPVLTVGDLKYGEGIDVSVESNPQIRIYALGVLGDLADEEGNLPAGMERIEYVICQPRLGGIKTWSEPVEDLLNWRDEVLAPALTAALGGEQYGAVFAPSESACKWCPARGACAALTEQRVAHAATLFEAINDAEFNGEGLEPASLTDTRLGEVLSQVMGLTGLLDDLKAEAQRRLHRGGAVPGFKMVSYTPPRKWKSDAYDKITAGLKGLDSETRDSLFKEPALRTPTQAIALLGDGASVLDPLIDVPAKRPVVAPENDRRHTWQGQAPEAMFQIEEEK